MNFKEADFNVKLANVLMIFGGFFTIFNLFTNEHKNGTYFCGCIIRFNFLFNNFYYLYSSYSLIAHIIKN